MNVIIGHSTYSLDRVLVKWLCHFFPSDPNDFLIYDEYVRKHQCTQLTGNEHSHDLLKISHIDFIDIVLLFWGGSFLFFPFLDSSALEDSKYSLANKRDKTCRQKFVAR